MPEASQNVLLLVETSSAHPRGLLRGIGAFAEAHASWHVRACDDQELPDLSEIDGIITRRPLAADCGVRNVVNVSGEDFDNSLPWVDADNRAVGQLVANDFRGRGYLHLGFFADISPPWVARRAEHLRRLAERLGMSWHIYEAERDVGAWLRALPKPIGLMAANDAVGQRLLQTCRAAEVVVPDDVAIVGVDNDDVTCSLCRPSLSSVVPDTEGIGYLAAAILDGLMRGEPPSQRVHVVAPSGLQHRRSTDAAGIDDPLVAQILGIIRRQATRDINVATIVAEVPASRRVLERRFRAHMGRSIHEELLAARLRQAQTLLIHSSLSIDEVAMESGFKRQEYMATVFRKQLQTTPSAFRISQGCR
jgi:LacI family transcriptional regulator